MSEQPLAPEARSAQPEGAVAWYGKLPSLGDFVGRRMPHALSTEWDTWLRSGMDELRALNSTTWPEKFVTAPLWFFAVPAAVTGTAVIGALAPSMDRVGRYYPLTVMATAPHATSSLADDARVRVFLSGARAAIVEARRLTLSPEELDQRLSHLASPFESASATPREPSLIDNILADLSEASYAHQAADERVQLPRGDWRNRTARGSENSLWWVTPTPRWGYDEHVHRGVLDRSLFAHLFMKQPPSSEPHVSPL
ncbi:MAG: type VI secretion system-associated protein TagF [Acidovorax sp.]|uniref:type VI secretion system-associated protein TagF n=1 Tax=Acidovorax sp. TaxID=1872122 RepID=UPI003919154B